MDQCPGGDLRPLVQFRMAAGRAIVVGDGEFCAEVTNLALLAV